MGKGVQKVISLKGGKSKDSEFQQALRAMREGFQEQIEYFAVLSSLHKAKFDACKREGFSDQQALELSKNLYGGLGG